MQPVSIRVDHKLIEKAEQLLEPFTAALASGIHMTRSDVLRHALTRGLEAIERDINDARDPGTSNR